MEKYLHSGGRFGNTGGQFINIGLSKWEEWHQNQKAFDFVETERDSNWITLHDASRDIWVLLPIAGGKSKSYIILPGSSSREELYDVTKSAINWNKEQPAPRAVWDLISSRFPNVRNLGIYNLTFSVV